MAVVERWTATRSVADCVAALEAAGVPCSAYGDPGDALADPHLVERGLFGRIHDAAGDFTGVNPPWRMSGSAAELRGRVPAIGADRDEVLREWLAATAGRDRGAGARRASSAERAASAAAGEARDSPAAARIVHRPRARSAGRAVRQARRVVRRVDLDVVVEVAIHVAPGPRRRRPRRGQARILDLRAAPPRVDARRPAVERGVAVAAGIELLVAVQAQVDEVGGQVLEQGPAAGGVGDDEGDAGAAAAARRRPGRRSSDGGSRPRGAAAGPRRSRATLRPARRLSCRRASASAAPVSRGSSAKKASKRAASKPSCGGNCQRIGPELGAAAANTPEAKKLASGVADVVQLQHVRDVARSLHARRRNRRASRRATRRTTRAAAANRTSR